MVATSRENAPERLRAAARAAVPVAASIRSATPSACARSSLSLRNARLREFARLREPRAEFEAALEDQRKDRGPAVAVQFQHGLARVRGGRGKPQRQPLIEHFATRIEKVRQRGKAWLQRAPDDAIDDARHVGTRHAHDADATAARRRRDRGNDVGVAHAGGPRYRKRRGPWRGQRRLAAAAAASRSSTRFMCHCWKICSELLTSQYSTSPDGKKMNMTENAIGMICITFACTGS